MALADNRSIMVIGDDTHFCYLMRTYIRKSDHKILFNNLNEDALELAQNEKPVAIVLEVGSPASTGWHLLKQLRSQQTTCEIPIVICSWMDEKKRAADQGASACLRMPILYEDFAKTLAVIGIRS
jgi:CheY-like chemotaxis protein